jgi:hypothetical protein
MKPVFPDYNGGSIVNLMSTIARARGGKTAYSTLKILPPSIIKDSKVVILLVIDGLGYDYVQSHPGILRDNLKGKMTSVFPPTTAAAITTYFTGDAPQEHGITGWNMHVTEAGGIMTVLRHRSRMGKLALDNALPFSSIHPLKSFSEKMRTRAIILQETQVTNTSYSKSLAGRAALQSCTSLKNLGVQLSRAVHTRKKTYIYAYWSRFDIFCHLYGKSNNKVIQHYQELQKMILSLTKKLKGQSISFIITADHGQIDTTKAHTISANDLPEFKKTLTLPLCGEPRAAYVYVRPRYVKEFEQYVKKKLRHVATLTTPDELIQKGVFGLKKPHRELHRRIGDYILLMKDNYVLRDYVLGEEPPQLIGYHGGVSREEMEVPLILFKF